jgi:hypothetical protein
MVTLSPIGQVLVIGSYLVGAVIGNILIGFNYAFFVEGFFGPNNVPQPVTLVVLLTGTVLGAIVVGRATSRYLHARELRHTSGE